MRLEATVWTLTELLCVVVSGRISSTPRANEPSEHDFTWLDWSYPVTLSADGQTLLFREEGEAGGPTYAVYIRKTDGSAAVRLGS